MTSYRYDAAGNVIAVTDPEGHTTRYPATTPGVFVSRVMSSGARSLYTYDAGGWTWRRYGDSISKVELRSCTTNEPDAPCVAWSSIKQR